MDLTHMYATFLLFCDPVNPLHPNISIHILYTLLFYTFPLVLTRRICLTLTVMSFTHTILKNDSAVIL